VFVPRALLALALVLLGSQVHGQGRIDGDRDVRGADRRTNSLRILVCGQDNLAWAARIRGQLSDLTVVVDTSSTEPCAADSGTPAHLAQSHGADLIVWLEPAPPGGVNFVNIWSARAAKLHRRAVTDQRAAQRVPDHPASETAHSALLEVGALAVRSSVRAELAERAARTVSEPNPIRGDAPASGAPPRDAAVSNAPSTPASTTTDSTRGSWFFGIRAGYLAFIDHSPGQLAAGALGGVTLADLSVSLGADIALASRVRVDGGALELTRQSMHLRGALNLAGPSDVTAGPWLELGLNRVRRETLPDDDGLQPTKPRVSFAGTVGAGAFVSFPIGQTSAVVLDAGALTDFPAREYLVARDGTDDAIRRRTWLFQPRVTVAWLLQF
jgi:hypothetical protein